MSDSYIGKAPQYGFFEKQRITTANGSLTAFNLSFTCADSNQLLVSVGGVIQEPGQSYTVLAGSPQQISFTEAKRNFYQAAKKSLKAKITWNGSKIPITEVLEYHLVPIARKGLKSCGVSDSEMRTYLDDIILQRIKSKTNGAIWQKEFIKEHGPNFKQLVKQYLRNQKGEVPVHVWKV